MVFVRHQIQEALQGQVIVRHDPKIWRTYAERNRPADLYPLRNPKLADLVEGAIGAGSIFEETFGYHADGVGPETAKLPPGWLDRAYRLNFDTTAATGICPEPNDLAVSKLVSGRPKDLDWVRSGLQAGLFSPDTMAERLADVADISEQTRELAGKRLRGMSTS
ncbi:hypothetical protein CKO28_26785 [Rhodovibrio sodomensis]|uniref:DUF6036 domain-containing protein n=1 Tax=Rhodovibrio sodomensis TaxID=1088 RepID=A0ABS1DPF3_9PROT|nr:hypothetical protein [Rhodovibrio sodomensis]